MTKEEEYKEALLKIRDIISRIEEQDFNNIDESIAKNQDTALINAYEILKEILK